MEVTDPQFWVAVFQIIAIDIALGADNAVVIALACRNLPENKRNQGIFWGMAGAIGIRVLLVFFALQLLTLPYLKIIGAFLLLWIGVKLLLPEPAINESGPVVKGGATTLSGVIKTIVVADAVMSLDNVMGIAGAAKDSLALVIFGLLFSVPIIVWGSKLVMKWIERFPVIIVAGAGLLGWIAGGLLTTDTVSQEWVDTQAAYLHWLAPVGSALLVISIGKWLAIRIHKKRGVSVDLLKKIESGQAACVVEGSDYKFLVLADYCSVVCDGLHVKRGDLMLKMLLPVDGSEASQRAVEEFVKRLDWYRERPDIHLLNVRIPLTGNVSMFVSKEEIGDYYREEGLKGLQQARDHLEEKGVAYRHHIVVGEIVPMILQFSEEIKCDQIIIGPRGLGAVKGLLLGSVANKLIQLSTVPVLLLK